MASKICIECGGPNLRGYGRHCSKACGSVSRIRKLKEINKKTVRACKHCGKPVPYLQRVYCSEECRRIQQEIDNPTQKHGPPKPSSEVMAWIRKCQRASTREQKETPCNPTAEQQWRQRCRTAAGANRYREFKPWRKYATQRPQRSNSRDKAEAIRWWLAKAQGVVLYQEPERDHSWLWKRKCANAVTNHRKRLERKDVRKSRSTR